MQQELHFWSVCADFQFSMFYCLVMMGVFRIATNKIIRANWSIFFSLLFVSLSLCHRAYRFDLEKVNVTKVSAHLVSIRDCDASFEYWNATFNLQFKNNTEVRIIHK